MVVVLDLELTTVASRRVWRSVPRGTVVRGVRLRRAVKVAVGPTCESRLTQVKVATESLSWATMKRWPRQAYSSLEDVALFRPASALATITGASVARPREATTAMSVDLERIPCPRRA
jgi:hypothetical protein